MIENIKLCSKVYCNKYVYKCMAIRQRRFFMHLINKPVNIHIYIYIHTINTIIVLVSLVMIT